MEARICKTCGVQYPPSDAPPEHCPVCQDDRQYVGWDGQQWTTLIELRREHRNEFRTEEPGLLAMQTSPKFAIGQRCFVVQSPGGNVLWECISLIDDETIGRVRELGGLRAIAISHPHYYSTMIEWSRAFGGIPIYLHEDERRWVMHPDNCVQFWSGETMALHDGLTLVRCGGHFPGGQVLHWPAGAEGRGVLLTGDILQVVPDRRFVSFMHSYPNLIPLPAPAVRRIVAAVEPFEFDRIYGISFGFNVDRDAKAAVRRSADRYIRAIAEHE